MHCKSILLLDVLHTIVHSILSFIENCCFNRMIASHYHSFHMHFGIINGSTIAGFDIIKGSSIRSFHTLAHFFWSIHRWHGASSKC